MFDKYESYEESVSKYIDSLSTLRCIAYCIIVCKRFFEFFPVFHNKTGFGNPKVLIEAQKFLENIFAGLNKINIKEAKKLLKELDGQIPDSDDWTDCSNAMDAATVHYYSIDFLIKNDKQDIKYLARYCYDYVDRTAQDEMQIETYSPDNEAAIENHKFVVDEVNLNLMVLKELSDKIDEMNKIATIVKQYSIIPFAKI
jgi:uncharacterized protein YjaG (DUF416 family)